MVDSGEKVSETLRREFQEEALNSLEATEGNRNKILILTRKLMKNLCLEEKIKLNEMIADFFKNGQKIYEGYVDDPRNTDNSWMETVAYNFHDDCGTSVGKFPLQAGDDASKVQWMDISRNLNLYASHLDFIKMVCERHAAHW